MKDLLTPPTPDSDAAYLADFVELNAYRAHDGNWSQQDLIDVLRRPNGGSGVASEDRAAGASNRAFDELTHRQNILAPAKCYPFVVDMDLLRLKKSKAKAQTDWLYPFLLSATRLNMGQDRSHGQIDGTLLFERFSLDVAKNYWCGGAKGRVEGMLFGTSRDGANRSESFSNAINQLCQSLREGGEFVHRDAPEVLTAKDGKLDVVVWRGFGDRRSSQLIGMGQCKTGDSWEAHLGELVPGNFCGTWLRDIPRANPVKLFFLTDRVVKSWHTLSAGMVLFDRCRLLEYAGNLSPEVLRDCERWTRAVFATKGINW